MCFKIQIFSVESFKSKLVWMQGKNRGPLSPLQSAMCKTEFGPSPLPLMTDVSLNEKEAQKGDDICICMADSFCYTVDTIKKAEH